MVATAANTYISGSQFTFKWNFNTGERSHTESLIYMKPVLRGEEQCTVCRDRRGRKLQETRLFSQMFTHISMQWTKRRGHKRGWGTRKIQITGLASFPVPGPIIGTLGCGFPPAQCEWSPLQDSGSCFSQDRWEKLLATESHITLLKAYTKWMSVL